MDFEKYKNTVPHPDQPKKPLINMCATAEEFRKHADALDKYEKEMEEWRKEIDRYRTEEQILFSQFKEDALKEAGLQDHPKRDKAFALAWEYGHSSGYSEVLYHLSEFAGLLLD